MKKTPIAIHWFRRDLRLEDNASLWTALKSGFPVLPIFIFDTNILDKLQDKKDPRVLFIHQEVSRLKQELEKLGSTCAVFYGSPLEVWQKIIAQFDVKHVFTNRDYEPYAQQRDKQIYELLASHDITFKGAKDHVIFEKEEVLKDDGKPYTIFTPYSKKWKARLTSFHYKSYPTEKYFGHFLQTNPLPMPSLGEMGFEDFEFDFPSRELSIKIVDGYSETRDIPSIIGTSRLSLHLRFGTVSIRKLTKTALAHNEKWLNELIWRDFYQMILFHFPHSVESAFKPQYDRVQWLSDAKSFERWCAGTTGYPIVDAGMRELNTTGFMHNRVRMIVASFLTKHLLIDWRLGEQYFAAKLLDYDLASNVGGWQWAASSGCDAAPYFRIFNPSEQTKKFDPEFKYIRKWVPEFGTPKYPVPIVDHKFARDRVLTAYKTALSTTD
jgi:deoxyribodipyrimidine photo-lyase